VAKTAKYYSSWRKKRYACKCGWKGPHDEMSTELFDSLIELSCPECDAHLLLVPYPTFDEVKTAAAKGNKEAQAGLPQALTAEAPSGRF
jgi:hypothetical protein